MLASLKRLFASRAIDRDLTDISQWAQRRGLGFKRARGDDGFVIDGTLEGKPWRIEWGPPHRPYIAGHELRLRMELDLPSDMQMLLLSRPLMDALERQTFEEFTDNVQTQIGTKTPEEMRWLVMFPKVDLSTLKTLRAHFGAVASLPAAGLAWLDGPLAHALEQATKTLLRDDPPFVLMTLRGRVYLRMQLASPESKSVATALALFETAVTQTLHALQAAEGVASRASSRDSGATTAWQSLQPVPRGEPRGRR
ncbi:MAG: hypothetical protein KGL99_03695 [Burkholderiales bacterium]|nr:hypothetical protein [Burkholderiales bacterium]MDE2300477.1 hypothetical protein [Burkholderiales bacterium]MDE2626236.1 hypothetical protein [Burkholderiales bacterium]